MGRDVRVTARDGKEFDAYYASPSHEQLAPGLILLPEVYNVNTLIRSICDEYAEQGFCVLAPDMYWRQEPGCYLSYTPEGLAKAKELRARLVTDQFAEDLEDAIAFLGSLPECSGKVGVLGYCLGGKFAYLSAARHKIPAAVCYYAVEIDKYLNEAGAITCPLLMHFAETDASIPPEAVNAIKAKMGNMPNVAINTYPGTQHAFNRRGYPPHNPEQAKVAFDRTINHFRKYLARA